MQEFLSLIYSLPLKWFKVLHKLYTDDIPSDMLSNNINYT